MWDKVRYFLAAAPLIITLVTWIIGYQLDRTNYELNARKFREGEIPRKSLRIETLGGTEVTSLLKRFTGDTKFSLSVAGKEINTLYSIRYDIENTGEAPILKSDFSENLTVTFPNHWEILALNNSKSFPAEFSPEWVKVSHHTISLNPLLINPGDKFGLEIYLTPAEQQGIEKDPKQGEPAGTWTVRIPNLKRIDIQDPFSRKNEARKSVEELSKNMMRTIARMYGVGTDTLWLAGFLILPSQWGVYAILTLASLMIYVYLNFVFQLKRYRDLGKQKRILSIVLASAFSFAVSESYVTFFALLGKNVAWPNYVFMLLYVLSIIILSVLKMRARAVSALPCREEGRS